MKKATKILAVVLAAMLALCVLTACGEKPADGGGDTQAAAPAKAEIKGSTGEHGYYTVFVPDGYTLVHEDLFGDNSPDSFNINKEGDSLTYFMFNMYDEDNCQSSISFTKELNEGAKDVTLNCGGKTWTGIAYESFGIDCFSLYARFDDGFVLVSAAGNAYDGELTDAVLSSLTVNVTE